MSTGTGPEHKGGLPREEANLGTILRMNNAFWRSAVLHASTKLGIFTALSSVPLTVEELAVKCGTDPRATSMLLSACAAVGVVEKSGDRFRNASVAEKHLVEGKPGYTGNLVRFLASSWEAWGQLDDAVRHGRKVAGDHAFSDSEQDDVAYRQYILGMHNLAMAQAQNLARSVDLSGSRRLFDVGGGPGTYSVVFCQKLPSLRATVLDQPRTLTITREIIGQAGLTERISTVAGDFTVDGFGADNDVVLLSKMLHLYAPAIRQSVLKRAFAALRPGGQVIIHAELLDEERTGPEVAAMLGLSMLLNSDGGSTFSEGELVDWLREAGFDTPKRQDLPGQMSVVVARKPAS